MKTSFDVQELSITTQTAKTFRDVLGLNSDSDVLLEHYSTAGMQRSADVADNASSEFEDAGEHQRKLAAERWDNPIIRLQPMEKTLYR